MPSIHSGVDGGKSKANNRRCIPGQRERFSWYFFKISIVHLFLFCILGEMKVYALTSFEEIEPPFLKAFSDLYLCFAEVVTCKINYYSSQNNQKCAPKLFQSKMSEKKDFSLM